MDYDFGDKLGFGNLIVGAVYRDYKLETGGTLYTDYSAPIKYQEYGGYAQLKSNILQDKVTMTASVRNDKQNVMDDGNFTPRLGFLVNLSENQNMNKIKFLTFVENFKANRKSLSENALKLFKNNFDSKTIVQQILRKNYD